MTSGQTFADDTTLVERLRAGDMDALSALYLRHKDPLYTYCLRFGISDAECRDIVHDTFLRIHDRSITLQNGLAFRPWILTIARNIIFNKRRNDHLVFGDPPETATPDNDPLDTLVERDRSDALWAAIGRLDPLSREVLQLRIEQGLSYTEIAAVIGATEEAVRTRLYRSRKTLIEKFHRKEGKG